VLGEANVAPPLLHAVEHAVVVPVVARIAGDTTLPGAQRADVRTSGRTSGLGNRTRLAEKVLDSFEVVVECGVPVDGGHDASADVVANGHVPAGSAAVPGVAGRLAWGGRKRGSANLRRRGAQTNLRKGLEKGKGKRLSNAEKGKLGFGSLKKGL
jgi:hypothetical protein